MATEEKKKFGIKRGERQSYVGNKKWLMFRALPRPYHNLRKLKKSVKDLYDESPDVANRDENQVELYRKTNHIKVEGDNIPNPVTSFEEANLPDFMNELVKSFAEENGFSKPTAVQSQFWPAAFRGNNVSAVSPTGTGKTFAYVVPLILHVTQQPPLKKKDGPIAVILAPTRELVNQIKKVVRFFTRSLTIESLVLHGGANKSAEIAKLRAGVAIIVATPLRFLYALQEKRTNMKRCTMLVLDEAEMMIINMARFVSTIFTQLRPDCQKLLVGAHMSDIVKKLVWREVNRPISIIVKCQKNAVNDNIKQKVVVVSQHEKYEKLVKILEKEDAGKSFSTIIFADKGNVPDLASKLESLQKFNVKHCLSSAHQRIRGWVIEDFRKGVVKTLVTTDLLAVGIDIPDVKLVINYDLPKHFELYASRIGRTGRGGDNGIAYTLFSPEHDEKHAVDLVKMLTSEKEPVPPVLLSMVQKPPKIKHRKKTNTAAVDV